MRIAAHYLAKSRKYYIFEQRDSHSRQEYAILANTETGEEIHRMAIEGILVQYHFTADGRYLIIKRRHKNQYNAGLVYDLDSILANSP